MDRRQECWQGLLKVLRNAWLAWLESRCQRQLLRARYWDAPALVRTPVDPRGTCDPGN